MKDWPAVKAQPSLGEIGWSSRHHADAVIEDRVCSLCSETAGSWSAEARSFIASKPRRRLAVSSSLLPVQKSRFVHAACRQLPWFATGVPVYKPAVQQDRREY
jgi:hypothetical protein